jgi:DNA-binding response OmpR family regulator
MLPIKGSVLVVDDDRHILRMMQLILEMEGYSVVTAMDGEAALEVFDSQNTGLVLLDIRMPGIDGYTVCRRIRESSQVPIIMITAKGEVEEKAQGLDSGADDYITKPFSVRELIARIRAVLRRTQSWDEVLEPDFRSGDLVIDFTQHLVTLNGEEINLSATEHRLLYYLARHGGQVVTPDQLLEAIWGEKHIGEYHLLRVNITRLRRKLLDDPRKPKFIVTKVGIGYQFLKSQKEMVPQDLSVVT